MKKKKPMGFRKPTQQEIEELVSYASEMGWAYDPYCGLLREELDDEVRTQVGHAEIGVLDTVDSKTMIVIYDGDKADYMLYQWKDGEITAVVQDGEWAKVHALSEE